MSILMFTFSNFQFVPNCQKLWHLKNQLFLLLHTAWISLAYPLSPLPLTCDTHVVFLQWNVSQCVQIWIFNISNIDSFTQTIYLWYKYYPNWICVSFSFEYIMSIIVLKLSVCDTLRSCNLAIQWRKIVLDLYLAGTIFFFIMKYEILF